MKKILQILILTTFLFPSSVSAATSTVKEGTISPNDITYEPLILMDEKYDGQNLIRHFEYADTHRYYIQYMEVPKSIRDKVSTKDPESVSLVITNLALYYDKANNLQKLNELFVQYVPESAGSKISYSKEYGPTFSKNIENALLSISNKNEVSIPKDELTIINKTYGDSETIKKFAPYNKKDSLYNHLENLSNDLEVKWYEKISMTYVILGVILAISIILFIRFMRR